jgi:hypothetical protein
MQFEADIPDVPVINPTVAAETSAYSAAQTTDLVE